MTNSKKPLSDYEALIEQKEIELLSLRGDVRDFLDTKHKVKETKKTQSLVHQADKGIDNILKSLHASQSTSSEFRAAAEKLRERCIEMRADTRDMQKWLSDDLVERRHEKHDAVRDTTFLFGLPATFYVVVNQGLFDKSVNPKHAAGVGLLISGGVLFIKKITGISKATSRTVCRAPKDIKQDFTLFYIKETIKEKGIEARKTFRETAQSIGGSLSRAAVRTKKVVAKIPFYKKSEP